MDISQLYTHPKVKDLIARYGEDAIQHALCRAIGEQADFLDKPDFEVIATVKRYANIAYTNTRRKEQADYYRAKAIYPSGATYTDPAVLLPIYQALGPVLQARKKTVYYERLAQAQLTLSE